MFEYKKLDDELAVRTSFGSGGITIFPYIEDEHGIREHRHAGGVTLSQVALDALYKYLQPHYAEKEG